jgi:hypothetical protein
MSDNENIENGVVGGSSPLSRTTSGRAHYDGGCENSCAIHSLWASTHPAILRAVTMPSVSEQMALGRGSIVSHLLTGASLASSLRLASAPRPRQQRLLVQYLLGAKPVFEVPSFLPSAVNIKLAGEAGDLLASRRNPGGRVPVGSGDGGFCFGRRFAGRSDRLFHR